MMVCDFLYFEVGNEKEKCWLNANQISM